MPGDVYFSRCQICVTPVGSGLSVFPLNSGQDDYCSSKKVFKTKEFKQTFEAYNTRTSIPITREFEAHAIDGPFSPY